MSSADKPVAAEELKLLDTTAVPIGKFYRVEFAAHPDDWRPEPVRYVVLHRHPEHVLKLLVVESNCGPGAVFDLRPTPVLKLGVRAHLRWKDAYDYIWHCGGTCNKIIPVHERELPNPLREQLI